MTTLRLRGPENTAKAVWTVTQNLDGFVLQLRAQWLVSEEFWILYVSDAQGDPIISGIALIEGNDLFGPFADSRLPPGRLICHDTTRKHREPGRRAFIEDHALFYIQPIPIDVEEPVLVVEVGAPV